MPLTAHLSELRKRIFVSVASLFAVFVVIFNYSEKIFRILTFPLRSELKVSMVKPYFQIIGKTAVSLVFLAPAEAFWMHLKVSFVAAFMISLPVIFYQLWRF